MTRVLLLICVLALGELVAPAPAAPAEPVAWDELDWRLDRSLLVSRYLFHDRQPENPWEDYARTLGPDETPLADLLAEFAAREAGARARATAAAEDLLARGRLALLDRVYPLRDDVADGRPSLVGDFFEPTPGFGEAVTTAIERFAGAVRRDPTLAEAWYHLAYFTALAGDRTRAARAREAFFAVWPDQPAEVRQALQPLRVAAILDHAWALRNAGEYDDCLAWLDEHGDALPPTAEGVRVAAATEARLVRALVHAERGEVGPAQAQLPHLPLLDVPTRATAPLETYVEVDNQRRIYYQRFGSDLNPHHNTNASWQKQTADNLVRERRESSYLRRWVKAWTSLRRGYEPATVRRDLGRLETELEFPPRLAWRWWQDQGLLYEQLGEYELANVCWARAAVYRPYFIYHPTGQGRGLAGVHGLGGTSQPYFLAYGTFFTTGSLWSYAANAALASEVEDGVLERLTLRRVARRALDACIRRGLRDDEARALRGRLAFLDEDYAAAEDDLRAAWDALDAREAAPADLAFMIGLCHFNREDWDRSRPWLQTFTGRAPDAHVGWLALGLANAKTGRDDDALAALDRAVALAPDDATCLYNRGLLHYRLGRRDEARDDFRKAGELWPGNPQIAQMERVAGEDTFYELDVAVEPVRMDLPEAQRERLAELLAAGRRDAAAGELGDLVAASPEQREQMLAALARRHDEHPNAINRTRLAQACLLTGAPERVQALLAPRWPDRLTPVERRLLLYADRELGDAARAVDMAGSAAWAAQDVDLELLVLTVTILLEHDHRDLAEPLVARGLTVAPESAALHDIQRTLERTR